MKANKDEKIIYSINVGDVQKVAKQVLKRGLTKKETDLVESSIGDRIDWFQAVESSIRENIKGAF